MTSKASVEEQMENLQTDLNNVLSIVRRELAEQKIQITLLGTQVKTLQEQKQKEKQEFEEKLANMQTLNDDLEKQATELREEISSSKSENAHINRQLRRASQEFNACEQKLEEERDRGKIAEQKHIEGASMLEEQVSITKEVLLLHMNDKHRPPVEEWDLVRTKADFVSLESSLLQLRAQHPLTTFDEHALASAEFPKKLILSGETEKSAASHAVSLWLAMVSKHEPNYIDLCELARRLPHTAASTDWSLLVLEDAVNRQVDTLDSSLWSVNRCTVWLRAIEVLSWTYGDRFRSRLDSIVNTMETIDLTEQRKSRLIAALFRYVRDLFTAPASASWIGSYLLEDEGEQIPFNDVILCPDGVRLLVVEKSDQGGTIFVLEPGQWGVAHIPHKWLFRFKALGGIREWTGTLKGTELFTLATSYSHAFQEDSANF